MANFRTHLAGSAAAGAAAAAAVLSLEPSRPLALAGACAAAAAIGGVLPDVDHDQAVPARELFALLAAVLPAAALPAALARGLSVEGALAAALVAYVLVRFGVGWVFMRLTEHRGIFHSLPFALTAGAAAALAFEPLPLGLGASAAVGVVVHLALDELYAVDITGRRLRASFGTALKLRAPSAAATLLCYLTLAALAWRLWGEWRASWGERRAARPGPGDSRRRSRLSSVR